MRCEAKNPAAPGDEWSCIRRRGHDVQEDNTELVWPHRDRTGFEWTEETSQPTVEQYRRAWALLAELVSGETDPCRFDHNGNCQEHMCFGYDYTCDTGEARKLVAEVNDS